MNRKSFSSLLVWVPFCISLANMGLALAQTQTLVTQTPGTIVKFADDLTLTDSVMTEDPLTGTIGIGTTSPPLNPRTKISLEDNISTSNGTAIQLYNRANGNANKWVLGTGGAFVEPGGFSIGDSSTYRLVIQSNGNVGINKVNPGPLTRLDVAGDPAGTAVFGSASNGVWGYSPTTDGNGVIGEASSGSLAYGVWGRSDTGYAGFFSGTTYVVGSLDASDKHFRIDHPLDPANKFMVHASVESAERMNIYNGMVTLDDAGEATVTLPEWFEALNRDFRYQLTSVGSFAPVFIAEEISHNRFKIAGGEPGGKVSWQVTGVRHDAYADANPMQVEEVKSDVEKGFYLHPGLFGAPEEKGMEWAHHPDLMRQMKASQQK
jgi:hypothetical protein